MCACPLAALPAAGLLQPPQLAGQPTARTRHRLRLAGQRFQRHRDYGPGVGHAFELLPSAASGPWAQSGDPHYGTSAQVPIFLVAKRAWRVFNGLDRNSLEIDSGQLVFVVSEGRFPAVGVLDLKPDHVSPRSPRPGGSGRGFHPEKSSGSCARFCS